MRTPLLVAALSCIWLIADPLIPIMWLVSAPLAVALLAFAPSPRTALAVPFLSMAIATGVRIPLAVIQGMESDLILLLARFVILLYVPLIAVAGRLGFQVRLKHQADPVSSAATA